MQVKGNKIKVRKIKMCVYSDAHVRSVVNPSLMFMQSGI